MMMKAQFVPAWQSGRAQFKAAYWAPFSDDELAFLVAYMQEHLMIPTTEQIAAAVLAALQGTTIPVDTKLMNGAPVVGDGSELNPWRGVGVYP
ncbi:MAG: hypothetical protein ABFC56_06865 [Clostridiaceae bacterium]